MSNRPPCPTKLAKGYCGDPGVEMPCDACMEWLRRSSPPTAGEQADRIRALESRVGELEAENAEMRSAFHALEHHSNYYMETPWSTRTIVERFAEKTSCWLCENWKARHPETKCAQCGHWAGDHGSARPSCDCRDCACLAFVDPGARVDAALARKPDP